MTLRTMADLIEDTRRRCRPGRIEESRGMEAQLLGHRLAKTGPLVHRGFGWSGGRVGGTWVVRHEHPPGDGQPASKTPIPGGPIDVFAGDDPDGTTVVHSLPDDF